MTCQFRNVEYHTDSSPAESEVVIRSLPGFTTVVRPLYRLRQGRGCAVTVFLCGNKSRLERGQDPMARDLSYTLTA